jgi:hypothetical protein
MSVTILRSAAPVSTVTATCSQADLPLPDPACTPGALNPDVTQASIGSTICVSGWTATIRPPTAAQNAMLTDWTTAKSVLGIG